jgi:hypothetical protein
MRILPTLQKQGHPLAAGAEQRRRLAELPIARSFVAALADAGLHPLAATGILAGLVVMYATGLLVSV